MLRKRRSRLTAALVAASALGLGFAGYHAGAAGSWGSDGAGKSDRAGQAPKPCVKGGSGSAELVGDLDGDARPDKITSRFSDGTPSLNNGHAMEIQWGKEDGSFGDWVSINSLLETDEPGEVGTAAVADFNNDGVLDLVVNAVSPRGGEKPVKAHLAEYRPGPIDRSTLDSPDARHLDVGDTGEVRGMGVDRYGKDAYPDLVLENMRGGDEFERSVRLTKDEGGPGKYDAEANEEYGATGKAATPEEWPRDGLRKFYDQCGAG